MGDKRSSTDLHEDGVSMIYVPSQAPYTWHDCRASLSIADLVLTLPILGAHARPRAPS